MRLAPPGTATPHAAKTLLRAQQRVLGSTPAHDAVPAQPAWHSPRTSPPVETRGRAPASSGAVAPLHACSGQDIALSSSSSSDPPRTDERRQRGSGLGASTASACCSSFKNHFVAPLAAAQPQAFATLHYLRAQSIFEQLSINCPLLRRQTRQPSQDARLTYIALSGPMDASHPSPLDHCGQPRTSNCRRLCNWRIAASFQPLPQAKTAVWLLAFVSLPFTSVVSRTRWLSSKSVCKAIETGKAANPYTTLELYQWSFPSQSFKVTGSEMGDIFNT